ncbi:MAG: hypothetical protein Q8885_01740, partial [Candidatus Phytoplasma stylosanthis]|nr:hypothetical protein [Candidatus Phytoplasma stylosanthis]
NLLPLILIGFFFGFKYSFFSNLLYVCLHIILESLGSFHKHSLFKEHNKISFNNNVLFMIGIFLFLFTIPYLSCSLTGFFFLPINKKNKKIFQKKDIFNSLLIISIMQIFSYFLFVFFFYKVDNFYDVIHKKNFFGLSYSGVMIFLYYFFSVLITNTIIGFILYFMEFFFRENIEFFYLE